MPESHSARDDFDRLVLRDLVRDAVELRMTLYYGIDYGEQPDLSDAANTLGGVLAKMESVLNG